MSTATIAREIASEMMTPAIFGSLFSKIDDRQAVAMAVPIGPKVEDDPIAMVAYEHILDSVKTIFVGIKPKSVKKVLANTSKWRVPSLEGTGTPVTVIGRQNFIRKQAYTHSHFVIVSNMLNYFEACVKGGHITFLRSLAGIEGEKSNWTNPGALKTVYVNWTYTHKEALECLILMLAHILFCYSMEKRTDSDGAAEVFDRAIIPLSEIVTTYSRYL